VFVVRVRNNFFLQLNTTDAHETFCNIPVCRLFQRVAYQVSCNVLLWPHVLLPPIYNKIIFIEELQEVSKTLRTFISYLQEEH
jgi:hypothetical protein